MTQVLQEEEPLHLIAHGSIELLHGSKITHLRFLLGEWLCSLSIVYPSTSETLFQAASLLDRYLAKRYVPFSKLQLMACCCLWVSVKVELHTDESLEPLISYCHNKFTRSDFIKAEGDILNAVDYEIHSATALFFLKRFIAAVTADERVTLIASFLCESTLLFIGLSSFRPSLIAFCAIAASMITFNISQSLHDLTTFSSRLKRDDVLRCFGLVISAGRSTAARDQHIPFQKDAARSIDGVHGAGAALIKSVGFEADLVRRMGALLVQ
jgi:hypothetical protein